MSQSLGWSIRFVADKRRGGRNAAPTTALLGPAPATGVCRASVEWDVDAADCGIFRHSWGNGRRSLKAGADGWLATDEEMIGFDLRLTSIRLDARK